MDRAAKLADTVRAHTGDPALPALARERLGGPPEIVLRDCSHAYEHTLRELDLWAPRLAPKALLLLHDASVFAQGFGPTGQEACAAPSTSGSPANPAWSGMTLDGAVAPGADGERARLQGRLRAGDPPAVRDLMRARRSGTRARNHDDQSA